MVATLNAQMREDLKHSNTREIRENGNFPAVVYGYKVDNQNISISYVDFLKTIREVGRNGVINLAVEGQSQKYPVMLHDLQTDPLKGEVLHADFIAVNMSEKVQVDVAVQLTGEAQGVKDGGVIQQTLHTVSVEALPSDIPEHIEVDVSHLGIGDSIQVEDLKSGSKYEINDEDSAVIVTVVPPQAQEDTGEPEEEAAAEALEAEKSEPAPDSEPNEKE